MDQQRSPRYPAVSLADAVRAAKSLWAKEKRTPVQGDVLAKALGYKSHSGPARSLIGSMRQYGLLEKHSGGLRLSDVGMRVVHGGDEVELLAAIREAALSPDLFKELYDTHTDASEGAIKSHLILKKGFSEAGAKLAALAYKDTLSFAQLADSGYHSSNSANGVGANEYEEPRTLGRMVSREMERGTGVPEALVKAGQKLGAPLLTQTLVVSIPRNLRLDFSVHGDEIKREDLAKIKSQFTRWIEGLEEAFE